METRKRYKKILEDLKNENNLRTLQTNVDSGINLSTNDYLNLSNDISLFEKFMNSFDENKYKFGSCSSRLLSGNSDEYIELEKIIADGYNREECLIYNSGYHANTGVLPALASKGDLIVSDKLNHASIIDGMQLSRAETIRFRHKDYNHLEKILEKNISNFKNIFIVSESIFSMDGDIAEIDKLIELKKKYNSFLYIDEAHALGVRGKNGLGLLEEKELLSEVDFIVGTFGKALASIGAFIVCNRIFKQFLVNHSRSLIYTTALPPINLAWTRFVFELLPSLQSKREKLDHLSKDFSNILNIKTDSHIVPYILGTNERAISASVRLREHGFNVLPIRYPTVPENTARLRFSLNSDLKIDELTPIKELLESYE